MTRPAWCVRAAAFSCRTRTPIPPVILFDRPEIPVSKPAKMMTEK
uniref:Uncharacterized protein n=1 Tax=Picea sitchensis TaxID=3332 RepID=A9NM06_PICSI|nr:unknown [Picea sitchensis]